MRNTIDRVGDRVRVRVGESVSERVGVRVSAIAIFNLKVLFSLIGYIPFLRYTSTGGKLLHVFVLTCFALKVGAQETTTEQALEFADVKILSVRVNSSAEEIMPVVAADGNRLYFVRAAHAENIGGKLGGQDIWYSDRDSEGKWDEAKSMGQFNNRGNNAIVGVTQNTERIYLLNSYEDNLGSKSGLSFTDREAGNWTLPVVTEIKGVYSLGEKNDIYGLSVNLESDVLLISMKGAESVGQEDLYVSFKFTGWNRFHQAQEDNPDEEGFYWWSPPIHLGNVINSTGYEISPFLSADGKTLFFASDRKGGFGNADIYYATRLDDTWQNWSEPVNLGKGINSNRFDAYFHLTRDSTVYLSSARRGRLAEIYRSKLLRNVVNILEDREDSPLLAQPGQVEEPEAPIAAAITPEVVIPVVTNEKELEELNRVERNVLFDHDSDNLLLKDLDVLESTVAILKANQQLELHLEGHTDHVGSIEKNEILARKRAKAVSDYLVKHGIEIDRIKVDGAGEAEPVADNDEKTGRELNRRVELSFKMTES